MTVRTKNPFLFLTTAFIFVAFFLLSTQSLWNSAAKRNLAMVEDSQTQRFRQLVQAELVNSVNHLSLFQNESYQQLFRLIDESMAASDKVPSLKLSCKEDLPPASSQQIDDFIKRFRRSARLSTYQVYQNHARCLTLEEAKLIGDYKWGDYQKINSELRTGKPSTEVSEFSQGLTEVLKKLKTIPRVVFRGAGSPQYYTHLGKGSVFADLAFLSTSLSPQMPLIFSSSGPSTKMVLLTLSCPSISVRNPDDEAELLCPPETQFEVLHREQNANGDLYLVMSEVAR